MSKKIIRKEGYYTVEEVATMYGISMATMREWMRKGKVEYQFVSDYAYDVDRDRMCDAFCIDKESIKYGSWLKSDLAL